MNNNAVCKDIDMGATYSCVDAVGSGLLGNKTKVVKLSSEMDRLHKVYMDSLKKQRDVISGKMVHENENCFSSGQLADTVVDYIDDTTSFTVDAISIVKNQEIDSEEIESEEIDVPILKTDIKMAGRSTNNLSTRIFTNYFNFFLGILAVVILVVIFYLIYLVLTTKEKSINSV